MTEKLTPIPLSQLDDAESIRGLMFFATDENNQSVKVPIGLILGDINTILDFINGEII